MAKEDKTLVGVRKHVKSLIKDYEQAHWSDDASISENQIEESFEAEKLVAFSSEFGSARKEAIKKALKMHNLKQTDLAQILGHRDSYMSELINGVMPFSKEDVVIIHRLFKINFDKLIDPFIKMDTRDRIKAALVKLNRPQLKLKHEDLVVV